MIYMKEKNTWENKYLFGQLKKSYVWDWIWQAYPRKGKGSAVDGAP